MFGHNLIQALFKQTCPRRAYYIPVESKTRTYHERFGAARLTAGGGAGRDWTGCRQVGSPKETTVSLALPAVEGRVFNVSPKARTKEILCKPMEE